MIYTDSEILSENAVFLQILINLEQLDRGYTWERQACTKFVTVRPVTTSR